MRDDSELTAVLICAPEDWDHTDNSILIEADCGHKVWLAPTGQRLLAEHGDTGVARCIHCAQPTLNNNPDIKQQAAPGAMAELEQTYGTWGRIQIEAALRKKGITPNG